MTIKPFKDTVAKSTLVGSGSSAYVLSPLGGKIERITVLSAPSASYPNILRQGVSLRTLQQKSNLLPRIASKLSFDESGLFDYSLENLNYGQPKEFSDQTLYHDDIVGMVSGSPQSFLNAPPGAYYPVIMFDPSFKNEDINMMDGLIEPIPIRTALPNTTDSPYMIQGMKASLQMGNESEYAGSNIVTQMISKEKNSFSMFLDSQDLIYSSDTFKLANIGLSTKEHYIYAPFNSTLVLTSSIKATLLTSAFRDYGLVDQFRKSSKAGYVYTNNPPGTDSLSFGGLKNLFRLDTQSRVLDKPYRVLIDLIDSKTGAFPTIARNVPGRLGNYPVMFDDTATIIFATRSNDTASVQYPDMLQPGTPGINPRANDNPIIVSNQDIIPTTQQASRDHMFKSFSPGFDAFDDSRIYLTTSSYYSYGVPLSVYPGFNMLGPRNQVQIKINLTCGTEKHLLRLPTSRTPLNSEFSKGADATALDGSTGFLYYSFENSRWQDIGLSDPATGNPIPYDYSVEVDNTGLIISGTNLFPMQFSNSPGRAKYAGNNEELLDVGYDKIGSPINTSHAPFDKKYHATGSQSYLLTASMIHPLAVYKIVVDLPIVARKKQGFYDNTAVSGHTPMLVDGGSRDIDNYVFFIYRQRRNNSFHPIDSSQDVTGSKRFILCTGSMSFINSKVTSASLNLHTPAFLHDFNTPVSGSDANASNSESLYSGSIRLELNTALSNVGYYGMSSLIQGDETAMNNRGSSSPTIQNSWPGGTGGGEDPDLSLSFSLLSDPTSGGTGAPAALGFTNANNIDNPEDPANRVVLLPEDHRPMLSQAGNAEPVKHRMKGYDPINDPKGSVIRQSLRGYVSDSQAADPSPFILLPTDELIFGLEYGASNNIVRNETDYSGSYLSDGGDPTGIDSYSFFTGSFLKILAKEASVTLFGTEIQGDRSTWLVPTLNQSLTSEAISEPQGSPNRALDQFDLSNNNLFKGSYVEHVLTGTMVQGRAIAYSFSGGNLSDSGSIMRNVRHPDARERYYDSIMPSIKVYANEAGAIVKKSSVVFPSNTFIDEKGDDRMPFPYRGNPVRNIRDTTRIEALNGTTLFSDESTIFEALFTEGLTIKSTITNSITRKNPRMQGASATRYGIKNVRKEFSSAVFRRDRFGQFRDMLEQRLFSKFYVNAEVFSSPVENRFYDDEGNLVDADLTTVGNLSRESTSSLPYFDGIDHNRGSVTGSFGTLEVVGFGSIVKDVDKSEIPISTPGIKQKGSDQTS